MKDRVMYSQNESENTTDYCLIRAWQELDDVIALLKAARVAGKVATNEQVLDGPAMVAITHIPTLVNALREQSAVLESITFRVTGLQVDQGAPADTDEDDSDD